MCVLVCASIAKQTSNWAPLSHFKLMRFAVPNCNLTVSIWIDWMSHQCAHNNAKKNRAAQRSNMDYISITRDAITNIIHLFIISLNRCCVFHLYRTVIMLNIPHSNRFFYQLLNRQMKGRKEKKSTHHYNRTHTRQFSLHLNVCN